MGFLFTILRVVSYFFILCMATLCLGVFFFPIFFFLLILTYFLACGLYYIAELIEEHEKTTKKILKYSILVSIFFAFYSNSFTYL